MTQKVRHPSRAWGAALFVVGALLIAASLLWVIRAAITARGQIRQTYPSSGTAALSAAMCLYTAPPTENQSGVRLNMATQEELDTLPGIGPALAQEILLARESEGAFHFPEDLLHVKGIGESKLEELKTLITLP